MKKIYKLLIVLIILFIIVIVFIFNYKTDSGIVKTDSGTVKTDSGTVKTDSGTVKKNRIKLIKGPVIKKVDSIEYSSGIINLNKIMNSKDLKQCDSLNDISYINLCKDQINYDLGIESNKIEFCNKIKNNSKKTNCIDIIQKKLILSAKNNNDCNNIIDKTDRDNCLIKILLNYPESIKSIDDCNKGDFSSRDQCTDIFYSTQVRLGKSNNIEFCNKIKFELLKKECLMTLENNEKKDIKTKEITILKEKGDTLGVLKKECELNRTGNDVKYCILNSLIKEGGKTGNTSICNSIEDKKNIDQCILGINNISAKQIFNEAYSKKDISICKKISDITISNQCISIVGKK